MTRYLAYALSIALALLSLLLVRHSPSWWWGVAGFGALALLDLGPAAEAQHLPAITLSSAHFRYGLESLGRKYASTSSKATPPKSVLARQQRSL